MTMDATTTSRIERLRRGGEWLRRQREDRGWTARHLAELIGVTPIQVSSYERGRDGVGDERAAAIARAFNMSVIDTRAALGLWVPDDHEPSVPQVVPPEVAIQRDPTLGDKQRRAALDMLALIRRQAPSQPPRDRDPDAAPWRPGD